MSYCLEMHSHVANWQIAMLTCQELLVHVCPQARHLSGSVILSCSSITLALSWHMHELLLLNSRAIRDWYNRIGLASSPAVV